MTLRGFILCVATLICIGCNRHETREVQCQSREIAFYMRYAREGYNYQRAVKERCLEHNWSEDIPAIISTKEIKSEKVWFTDGYGRLFDSNEEPTSQDCTRTWIVSVKNPWGTQ